MSNRSDSLPLNMKSNEMKVITIEEYALKILLIYLYDLFCSVADFDENIFELILLTVYSSHFSCIVLYYVMHCPKRRALVADTHFYIYYTTLLQQITG